MEEINRSLPLEFSDLKLEKQDYFLHNHPLIEISQMMSKLRHCVQFWHPLKAKNLVNHKNYVLLSKSWRKLVRYFKDIILKVSTWLTEFHCDFERTRSPIEIATPQTTEKIHDILLVDLRLKVRKIVDAMGSWHG